MMCGSRPQAVAAGLPVRLSARLGDPHYDARALNLSDRIEVLLNGKVLDTITSYDVPAGTIVRHRRDESGRIVLGNGAHLFEELRGRVEVRWMPRAEGGAA
jgi:hypothetical protein